MVILSNEYVQGISTLRQIIRFRVTPADVRGLADCGFDDLRPGEYSAEIGLATGAVCARRDDGKECGHAAELARIAAHRHGTGRCDPVAIYTDPTFGA